MNRSCYLPNLVRAWLLISLIVASFPDSDGVSSHTASDQTVRLAVSVRDAEGKPVTDLSQNDFTVLVQGESRPITRFLGPSAPMRILIVLDTSGSMVRDFRFAQTALIGFVSSLGARDEVAVVSFTREPRLEIDFSMNPERVRNSIRALEVSLERTEITQLYDVIDIAIGHLKKSSPNMRTALIMMTDGGDRGSRRLTKNSSLRAASESAVPFYIFQPQKRVNSYLEELAEVSAGRLYRFDKLLEKSLEELAQHLRHHYVLEFTSSIPPQKSLIALEVRVSRPDLKVEAPTGFRPTPEN